MKKKVVRLSDNPKKLRKHLVELTDQVLLVLDAFEKVMKQPSTVERGQKIARILNALEQSNDQARFFGLGLDYRNDGAAKKRRIAQLRKKSSPSPRRTHEPSAQRETGPFSPESAS